MPLKKLEDKKPGGFSSTQQKGNIVKGKLKSQKELKKITSSDEYKKADYHGKTKMLNVATHLTGGQAKLDKNKNNKIDAQDFKILRKEKAKGRGQGLQDEKVKPGKVMKARMGNIIKPKGPGVLRPKPTSGGKPLKPKPIKPKNKMGGGMMQRPGYSVGGSVTVKTKLGRNKPTKMY